MLMRLLSSGLAAGLLAGFCVAGIQSVTTTPLILKAEVYEKAAAGHHHANLNRPPLHVASGAPVVFAHETAAPAPSDPDDTLKRTALTATATIGAAVGFALMLLAIMLASDVPITAATATLWGAAGFVVTGLAPGLGLAPELPGSVAADLAARQIWWITTASLTGLGLWSIWRWRTIGPVFGGIALIAIPHIWGAPHPAQFASTVPAELASHFTSSSLAVHAILWALTGVLAGSFWDRQATPQGTRV